MKVHWLIQTETDLPADDGWLAPAEAARLAELRFPKRRVAWRLGRWTAKRTLTACLTGSLAPSSLTIQAAADGAPEAWLDGCLAPFTFSISHSSGLALCATVAAPAALGCDLEKVEPRSETFVADYFTTTEQALVAQAPEADRPLRANLIWTAKESALKALRTGLRVDTRRVVVALPPGPLQNGWRPLRIRYTTEDRIFHGWWQPYGDFVMSLVADPAPDVPCPCPFYPKEQE